MPAPPAPDAPPTGPIDSLLPDLRRRRPRALGRAISVLERGGAAAAELIGALYAGAGRARVVGVTGPPGAGKSTLVDRLARLLRERGNEVGILAVDPTSPYSGGALLGDRIRMQSLATDPGVFIRSMATRGAMGGLARATRDAVDLLDAAGFDWVLVETVGVGQDEVDVVKSVDSVVVVTVPGLGDDIQAIKAGIMEIADVFVVNKADREGVERVCRDLETMLGLAPGTPGWRPPIVRAVASRGEGVADLLARVEEHQAWLLESGERERRRRTQLRLRVETILKDRVLAAAERGEALEREVERAMGEREDPYRVAGRLFSRVVGEERRGGSGEAEARAIDHIGLAVPSIDEARRFYETLGLAVEAIEEVPNEGVRVAMIPCGASRIELLEPLSEDSVVGRFLARRGPGIHHVCLSTSDLAGDSARLLAAGFRLLREDPASGAGGSRVQFVHPRSAAGVLYELAERPRVE